MIILDENMIILDEKVIEASGCFRRKKLWIKGWITRIGGQFTMGLTGEETVIEIEVIKPLHIFEVIDEPTHDFELEDEQVHEFA